MYRRGGGKQGFRGYHYWKENKVKLEKKMMKKNITTKKREDIIE